MIATIAKSLVQCLKFLQVYSADLSCLHVSHPKIENKYIPRYLYIHAYTFTIYFTCDYNIYSYHYQFCEIVLYFISMCTYIFTYILSKFNLQFFLHHSSNPPKKNDHLQTFFQHPTADPNMSRSHCQSTKARSTWRGHEWRFGSEPRISSPSSVRSLYGCWPPQKIGGIFFPPKMDGEHFMEKPMNKWMIWRGFSPLFLG